jgi:hypothetical protein
MQLFVRLKYSSILKFSLITYKIFLKNLFLKFSVAYTIFNWPIKNRKKTLVKSPHINKRSKENFKFTMHSFSVNLHLSLNYIKLLKLNLPKNIRLKISCTHPL